MKTSLKHHSLTTAVALSLGLLSVTSLHAANGTWSATPTSANWVTSGGENNWSTGADTFPGSITAVANADTATFLTSSTTAVTINNNPLYIRGISFGVSAATPSAFTIGTTAGNSLFLTSGGTTQLITGSTGTNITQTINAPIVIQPATGASAAIYTFANSNATATNTLVFGGAISGGTTTLGTTLNLTGTNGGANLVNGVISDGGSAGGLAVTAFGGATTWGLAGANTYTGATTVFGNTNLSFRGANGSALNTSAITLGAGSGGGTIRLDNRSTSGGANANRLSDTLAINSNGSSSGLNFLNDAAAATNYSETVGTINLNDGHFITTVSAAAAGQSSILTLGGLNRVNPLATIAFTSGNADNIRGNTFITGQADSTFLGGWATVTTGSFAQYSSTRGVFAVANTNLVGVTAAASSATTSYNLAVNGTTTLATANDTYLARSLSFGNTTAISPVLDLNGSTLKITGGGIANASDLGGSTINNGTITVGDGNSSPLYVTTPNSGTGLTVNAVIADNGGPLTLVKSGGGLTLTLAGANTFTGKTYSNSGSVAVTNALGLQNSVIDYNNHGGTVTFSNLATFNPVIGGIDGVQNITVGSATVGASLIPTFTLGNSNATTGTNASYSGVLGNNAVFRLIKTGANTQTLSGANNFTGGVTINGGTLEVGGTQTSALGALGQTGSIVFGGGTLRYSGTNTFDYSSRIAAGTSTSAVAINTNGLNVTFGTGLTASQSGGLTKLGAGTLTLSTVNAYTGTTTVGGGTLLVNGSTASGAVSVLATGIIGGTGTVGGATTLAADSKLSAGDSSASTLTFSSNLDVSVAANNSAAFVFTLGSTSDLVAVNGTLAIGTGLLDFADFSFTAGSGFTTGTYTLFDNVALNGALAASGLNGTISGFDSTLSISGNDIILTVATIPEPSTYAMLLGSLGMLIGIQRFRLRNRANASGSLN